MNPDEELIAELRMRDPDRLYTALFAKEPLRSRLIHLFSFNLEVASTREKVSETMLGQIRLQWWRDALNEISEGRPRAHPVVEGLSTWMPGHGASLDLGQRMIDAREADLEDAPFETLEQLVGYADATGGNLMALAQMADAGGVSGSLDNARRMGRAYALTGLIRSVPFLGAQGRVMLPGQLLARHGIMDARQSIGRDPDKLKQVLREIAEEADKALTAPTRGLSPVARMHGSLARLYLTRIRKADFDLSSPRLDPNNAVRIARLFAIRVFAR